MVIVYGGSFLGVLVLFSGSFLGVLVLISGSFLGVLVLFSGSLLGVLVTFTILRIAEPRSVHLGNSYVFFTWRTSSEIHRQVNFPRRAPPFDSCLPFPPALQKPIGRLQKNNVSSRG